MIKQRRGQLCLLCFFIIFCHLMVFVPPFSAEELRGNLFKMRNYEAIFEDLNKDNLDEVNFENVAEEDFDDESDFINSTVIDISGIWKGQCRSGGIKADGTFRLSQSGNNVTGTWESRGAYPTHCGVWTGWITGSVSGSIFSFDGTSPMKDLDTCEVVCIDPIEATFTINGNRMTGDGTEIDCMDEEVMNFTCSLEREEPLNIEYSLTVVKSGTGSGTVTSSPAGIDCGSNCTEDVKADTKITLKAKADTNSTFTGWSGGGCSGTGTCAVIMNADIAVTAAFSAKTPDISISPSSLDFGSVNAGKKVTKTLKIMNNGSGNLVTTLSGLEGTDFSIQGSSSVTIKAKKSYTLKVLCTPTSGGLKTATLKIDSNDPDTPTLEISLTATLPATTPDISVVQTSIEFGGIKVGKKATKTLKIANNGTGDLIITLSGLEGTDFSIQGSSSVTIKAKKSYTLKVLFTPGSTGLEIATLTITSNDPDTPTIDISLSGTGQ